MSLPSVIKSKVVVNKNNSKFHHFPTPSTQLNDQEMLEMYGVRKKIHPET